MPPMISPRRIFVHNVADRPNVCGAMGRHHGEMGMSHGRRRDSLTWRTAALELGMR